MAVSLAQTGTRGTESGASVAVAFAAAPLFVAARAVFVLDEIGAAMASKLAASLFVALAAAALFITVARRRSESEGTVAALALALGTPLWSTSQSLLPEPLAALGIAAALLFL